MEEVEKIKVGGCPHEFLADGKKWSELLHRISEKTGKDINLVIYRDFEEERKKIKEEEFDLYYASPEIAVELYRKGYVPVGAIKGQEDEVVLVSKENLKEKEFYKVALVNLKLFMLGLLNFKNIDKDRIELVFTKSHEETIEKVQNCEVDYGIIYGETLKRLKPQNLKIVSSGTLKSRHFFMAKKEKAEYWRKILSEFKEVEILNESAIEDTLKLFEELEELLTCWQEHDTAKAIQNIEGIGVLIYRDRIIYANKYAREVLGYSEEEIRNLSALDLVSKEYRETIQKIVERRLKGERFPVVYKELKVKTKEGKSLWILAFSQTILYEGQYAGFVIFVDITKRKRLEKLYKLLREINQTITGVFHEGEIFEKICHNLVKNLDLKFVWVGKLSEKGEVIPVYTCGEEEDYVKKVKISINPDEPEGWKPTAKALREGKIVINPNTLENPDVEPWREEMLKRNFLSSCAIPIQLEGGTGYVINLYASEPYYFEEENKEILYELKEDVEFVLRRVRELRNYLILSKALEESREWVLITDREGKIIYVNKGVEEISKYSAEELIGKTPRIFKSGYHPQSFFRKLWQTILSGKPFHAVFVNKNKYGELFYLDQKIIPLRTPEGDLFFIGLCRDITKEVKLTEEVEWITTHNVETGLLNKVGFQKVLSPLLGKLSSTGALIALDMVGFSRLIKEFGEEAIKKLLKEIAVRLEKTFRRGDIIAKGDGDEFLIFAYPLKKKDDVLSLIEKIRQKFSKPLTIDGKKIRLSFYIGVVTYPYDGRTFSELYYRAITAVKEAKRRGAGEVVLFDKELDKEVERLIEGEKLLRKAVEENLFTFHFQPIYRLRDMKIFSLEALVRIKEGDKIHYPGEFIELLERGVFIKEFEEWMIRELRRLLGKWNVPISVNLSAINFKNDEFMENLNLVCKEYPGKLILEITERLLIENVERTRRILGDFRECGLVAVDDFGTGYSSFSYLKELPLDLIKIDMMFIKSMLESSKDLALVEAIVFFAQKIGLKTLGEGIENAKQLEMLKRMGYTYGQGFYLAKPMPEEEVEKLLREEGLL